MPLLRLHSLTCVLCFIVLQGSCSTTPPKPVPSQEQTPTPEHPVQTPGSTSLEAIERALKNIQDKSQCNRVMGCPPASLLLKSGTEAIAPILRRLESGNPNAPWFTELIDLLGSIPDSRTLPFLRTALKSTRWLIRSHAAIALGRLKDSESRRQLTEMADSPSLDVATVASAAYALVRLGDTRRNDTLLRFATESAIRTQNWGWSTLVVELATDLRLRRAAPGFRVACQHRDFFLRRAAIRGIRRIRDLEGVGCLIDRLTDPIPSIRRESHGHLQDLTGEELPLDAAAWETWCTRTTCRTPKNLSKPAKKTP